MSGYEPIAPYFKVYLDFALRCLDRHSRKQTNNQAEDGGGRARGWESVVITALIKECIWELHRTRHMLMQAMSPLRDDEIRARTKVSAHIRDRKEAAHGNMRQYDLAGLPTTTTGPPLGVDGQPRHNLGNHPVVIGGVETATQSAGGKK